MTHVLTRTECDQSAPSPRYRARRSPVVSRERAVTMTHVLTRTECDQRAVPEHDGGRQHGVRRCETPGCRARTPPAGAGSRRAVPEHDGGRQHGVRRCETPGCRARTPPAGAGSSRSRSAWLAVEAQACGQHRWWPRRWAGLPSRCALLPEPFGLVGCGGPSVRAAPVVAAAVGGPAVAVRARCGDEPRVDLGYRRRAVGPPRPSAAASLETAAVSSVWRRTPRRPRLPPPRSRATAAVGGRQPRDRRGRTGVGRCFGDHARASSPPCGSPTSAPHARTLSVVSDRSGSVFR